MMFQGYERVSCVAVFAGSKSSDFIKNVLICFMKMNGLTGLERHGGE